MVPVAAAGLVLESQLHRNKLLAQLRPRDAHRLVRALELVRISAGEVLTIAGERPPYVYFPAGCLVSVFVVRGTNRGAHVGLIGSEGFVGLAALLESEPDPYQLVCQIAGEALRIASERFRALLRRHANFRRLLLRYTGARVSEEVQSLACYASHPVTPRLARWLLIVRDRIDSDTVPLTHQFLAEILAVRRPYLSELMRDMQRSGHLKYQRGQIRIINAQGLASVACEDYLAVRSIYERLFRPEAPAP